MKKFLFVISLLFISVGGFSQTALKKGKGSFIYNEYEPLKEKPVPVHYYNPSDDPAELPILFVMHGTNRNADDYRDNWKELAEKHQILVIVPELSKQNFPGSRSYNLGGMFDKDGEPAPEEKWAYSLIEPIFDYVKELTQNQVESYDIFGHSAGSQFVHRFALFKQDLRVNKIITANAGWYTMPDLSAEFPYGLVKTTLTRDGLVKAFEKEMVILLGTEDNDPNHRYLRTASQAMAQGPHRLARGKAFFKQAQVMAKELEHELQWRISFVPGVGHNNADMAIAAAAILYPESMGGSTDSQEIDGTYMRQAQETANHPKVKKAFQTIEELDIQTVADQILLNEIPAPPFKEEERAQKFALMMESAGADSVWIDNVGNVIAERRGYSGKRTVVIEGHLDTVFPEGTDVTVVKKGDTLYAPGIGDNTRGLALLITLMKAMEQNDLQTRDDVLFIGTVGEEGLGDLRGVKNLFSDQGPRKIDSYIAVDGGNFNRIVNKGLGSKRYRVTFKGPGGHSWGAFGLPNPHNALGRAINLWSVDANALSRQKGLKVSYNVGVIGGGTSVNSIPYESWMEVDMRSEDAGRLEAMDNLLHINIRKALEQENDMAQRGSDLILDLEMIGNRPTGEIPAQTPLVQRTMAATKYLGGNPRLTVSSTNANTPISLGVPAVTIGRGGKGGNAHSLNEWWINQDGYLAIQKALLILLNEAGFKE